MAKDKLKKLLARIDTFKSDLESLRGEIQAAVNEDEAEEKRVPLRGRCAQKGFLFNCFTDGG